MQGDAYKVYIFDVVPKDSKGVMVRIACTPDRTLDELHDQVRRAFDRPPDRLYVYRLPISEARARKLGSDVVEYVSMYDEEEDDFPEPEGVQRNSVMTMLSSLRLKEGQRFDYDFDGVPHEITVSRVYLETSSGIFPRVIERRGLPAPTIRKPRSRAQQRR